MRMEFFIVKVVYLCVFIIFDNLKLIHYEQNRFRTIILSLS